jgi:phosphoribosyl-AMP cyclohydrolase
MMLDLRTLNFDQGGGLVTVVAQDARTGAVLMLAHADRAALERTIENGEMHYHSGALAQGRDERQHAICRVAHGRLRR